MIGDICTKPAITVAMTASVEDAARIMRGRKVGALIVTNGPRPVGILTDRDITVDVVAAGKEPAGTKVADVMRRNPTTLREDDGLLDAAKLFSAKGVRRLPVTSKGGRLIGIVTLDDLMMLLGREMELLGTAVAHGMGRPRLAG